MDRRCGRLLATGDGHWFYGEIQVGKDGHLDADTLLRAITVYAEGAEPQVEAWKPPVHQLSFAWPVAAPGLVNVDAGLTVAQAHAQLWPALDEGAFCPVCQRMARRYARPFHKEMAIFLVYLVRAFLAQGKHKEYIELRGLLPGNRYSPKSSTDGSYLVEWRLIKRKPKEPGWYMPSPAGIAFVRGQTRVPKIAWIYAKQAHHFSQEQISITDALATEIDVMAMLRDIEGYEGR